MSNNIKLNHKVLNQLGYEIKEEKITYKHQEIVSYSIYKNDIQITSLEIPSTYTYNGNEYKITAIENEAFKYFTNLKSIIIPEGVEIIEEFAFYYCLSLKNVIIPNTVNYLNKKQSINL